MCLLQPGYPIERPFNVICFGIAVHHCVVLVRLGQATSVGDELRWELGEVRGFFWGLGVLARSFVGGILGGGDVADVWREGGLAEAALQQSNGPRVAGPRGPPSGP